MGYGFIMSGYDIILIFSMYYFNMRNFNYFDNNNNNNNNNKISLFI